MPNEYFGCDWCDVYPAPPPEFPDAATLRQHILTVHRKDEPDVEFCNEHYCPGNCAVAGECPGECC